MHPRNENKKFQKLYFDFSYYKLPKSNGCFTYFKLKSYTDHRRVDRASATKTVDSGLIPSRVTPKTKKFGVHNFPAWRSAIKGTVWSLHRDIRFAKIFKIPSRNLVILFIRAEVDLKTTLVT